MTSVYFDPAVGGDGTTVTDDANPTTGLANGGHRTRFVPALSQVVAVADFIVDKAGEADASADAAAASASSALNAPGTSATSSTSLAIEAGSKTFTIQTGKAFVVGQFVVAASAANVANYMHGQITAHNATTGSMTVNVTAVDGAGTFSDWSIGLSAPGSGDVTLTGTQTLSNKTLTAPQSTGAIYNNGSIRGNVVAVAALEIDCSAGNYFTKTISGSSTFTFVNAPASRSYAFTLELTVTSGSATWPAAVQWPSGAAPTLSTSKTSLLMFVTDDGGTRWRGASLVDYTT